MMELTKANIDVGQVGEWEDPNTWQCTMQFFESKEEAEQVKQQLLNDYEKARKFDEIKDGTLGFIRAFNWLDKNKSIFLPTPNTPEPETPQPRKDQNQKLRELIEELTDGDFQTITRAFGTSGIYTSIQLVRILDIFNRLQNLLEGNKNEN